VVRTKHTMMHRLTSTTILLGLCAIFFDSCHAFVTHKPNTTPVHHRRRSPEDGSQLRAIPPEIADEVASGRGQFYLWFFGASGGLGIALGAFPQMYGRFQDMRALKGTGPSLGGDTVGLNPLCGYPEDLSVKDLEKIVNNKLNIEQIVEKFPIENNFLSKSGYVTFAAYEKANQGCNPLAVRAVFDTFAQSADACDPFRAQDKIDSYKEDIYRINGGLLNSKATGYAAIGTLLFLFGLADVIVLGHAKDGWFPGWTWADGIFNIPQYWV